MKKIFTLVAAVTIFATASFAQRNFNNQATTGYNRGNDVAVSVNVYKKDDARFINNFRERDMEIARINREYDFKVMEIRSKLFMSHFKKEMLINQINEQRRFAIANVYSKFNGRGFKDNDYRRH